MFNLALKYVLFISLHEFFIHTHVNPFAFEKRTSECSRARAVSVTRSAVFPEVCRSLASPPLPHRAIEKSGKRSLTH